MRLFLYLCVNQNAIKMETIYLIGFYWLLGFSVTIYFFIEYSEGQKVDVRTFFLFWPVFILGTPYFILRDPFVYEFLPLCKILFARIKRLFSKQPKQTRQL